jgi:PPE-repeat protein
MDFGLLPPEINSGRMYSGQGPGSWSAASAGWDSLATGLTDAAGGYQSVIAGLIDESWLGPSSMSMAAAVTPYLSWMTATAAQCARAAANATAAATAFETAYAMTVPPPLVARNRSQLVALIATNVFGQNTPAIMATEAEYGEMWAQDATAMYNYAANSASASAFSVFTSPPHTTTSGGLAGRLGVVAQATGSNAPTTARWISSVSETLRMLATPGAAFGAGVSRAVEGSAASAGVGQAASLGTLSVPPSWADAVSENTPPPALDANVMPGGWGAAPSVRRVSDGTVRIGLRSKPIPRSPVAG